MINYSLDEINSTQEKYLCYVKKNRIIFELVAT
jgi:hypothetical protein